MVLPDGMGMGGWVQASRPRCTVGDWGSRGWGVGWSTVRGGTAEGMGQGGVPWGEGEVEGRDSQG